MNNKHISEKRWHVAQDYEKGYWESRVTDPVGVIHDFESGFRLALLVQAAGLDQEKYSRIIDIGVGGLGIGLLWMFEAASKIGIDPLDIHKPQTTMLSCRMF